jgi:16S rRNA (guanine966-N2)-methyltransferase
VTRIISGQARGRRLRVPSSGTRPTSDRVREALFASVESRLLDDGTTWDQTSVCDLWAGSGAIALEAWSRGAERVLMVEKSSTAVVTIKANIDELGAQSVDVIRASVSAVLDSPPLRGPFTVVFADPPYEYGDESIRRDLTSARATKWFAPDAIVVVERRVDADQPFPAGFDEVERRTYGDTALWYGRAIEWWEDEPR